MIEVRYAGVVVGRSAIIRELDTRGLFLAVTEPLPVGTPVVLRIGDRPDADEVPGKVEAVSESPELANAGMRVRFADPAAATLFGTPGQAAPEPVPVVRSGPVAAAPSGPIAAVASAPVAAVPSAPVRPVPSAPVPAAPSAPMSVPAAVVPAQPVVAAVPEPTSGDEGDLSGGLGGDSGRIPAPNPGAFGGHGGGKKNRRNRRR